MAGPGNGARRFTVHCSGAVTETIRRVHRRAWHQGRGTAVTRALRQIVRRLEFDPFDSGEPAYRLPGLRMQIRTIVVRPPVVDFAACEDRPLVFLKGVKLLPRTTTSARPSRTA
jgi:hypothetical protein